MRTEERADRWMVRKFGFVDRRSLTWSAVHVEVNLRIIRRELARSFAPLLRLFR